MIEWSLQPIHKRHPNALACALQVALDLQGVVAADSHIGTKIHDPPGDEAPHFGFEQPLAKKRFWLLTKLERFNRQRCRIGAIASRSALGF